MARKLPGWLVSKPVPTSDGIVVDASKVYWAASRQADFYGLGSFLEDDRPEFDGGFLFRYHATWLAEVLLFTEQFLRTVSANGHCQVRFALRYGGLDGRSLGSTDHWNGIFENYKNRGADIVSSEAQFSLGEFEKGLPQIVQKLFDPVCVVFDYYQPDESFYSEAIAEARWQVK